MPEPDRKAAQKAVNALIASLGLPEARLSSIQIECSGLIRVVTRDRATFTAAHVSPFRKDAL